MRSTELGLKGSELLLPVHVLASCFTAFKRLSMNGKTFGGLKVKAASILESIFLRSYTLLIILSYYCRYANKITNEIAKQTDYITKTI